MPSPQAAITIDHEFRVLIPPLSADERAELESSLLSEGCRDAIVTWNGVIIDGHNRHEICTRLGIQYQTVEREFANREAAREWIIRNQFGRRNLSSFVRAELSLVLETIIAARARERQGARTDLCPNLDKSEVHVLDELAAIAGTSSGNIHKVKTVLRDAPEPVKNAARANEISTHRAYQITKAVQTLPENERSAAAQTLIENDSSAEIADLIQRQKPSDHQRINQSTSNEWYTPKDYIDSVLEVLGSVDVDPASNEYANETIKAAKIYTIDDDGFDKPWIGKVFLNPPYGRDDNGNDSNQSRWSARLIEQYRAGITTEAILLVNAVPGNRWFAPLWDFPICFVGHRIRFYNRDTAAGAPTHSNAIVYLGPDIDRFARVFSRHGAVAVRYMPKDVSDEHCA